MDRFDEKIIGYESTKNILRQILDALKRPELYKSKGASIPRGLLMESDPGLGKSLLATVFIKESGRKSLVFRKTSQENSFLDELRAAFLAAKEAAPSILLLEDLNLYVESNSPYAPEWACLQACISVFLLCIPYALPLGKASNSTLTFYYTDIRNSYDKIKKVLYDFFTFRQQKAPCFFVLQRQAGGL